MANSVFNAELFMQQEYESETSTKLILPPADDYQAVIDSLLARQTTTKEGELFTYFNVAWELTDQKAKDACKRDKVLCYQMVPVDLTDSGSIDMSEGKSIQLGRVRDAVGQNKSTRWSPTQLKGAYATVKVTHSLDKRDNETMNANVVKVTKL